MGKLPDASFGSGFFESDTKGRRKPVGLRHTESFRAAKETTHGAERPPAERESVLAIPVMLRGCYLGHTKDP